MTPGTPDPAARAAGLADAAVAGDRRALARLLTAVEMSSPVGEAAVRILHTRAGRAHVVGVTGAPGSGKSTLVNAMLREFRARGRTVAVVAVDPSSPISGGAILGDRIRMQDRATDQGVYIRSMATRGHMGGLAVATGDILTVLDAAGFDVILVETVGVGQDEVDIIREADTVVVVLVPGLGDDIQAIKAGIMEIADVFVINKADREGVDRVERELHALLTLPGAAQGWTPPVVKTVASRQQGISDLVEAAERHRVHLATDGGGQDRLRLKYSQKFRDILSERFLMEIFARHLTPEREELLLQAFLKREEDPYTAAEAMLGRLRWK